VDILGGVDNCHYHSTNGLYGNVNISIPPFTIGASATSMENTRLVDAVYNDYFEAQTTGRIGSAKITNTLKIRKILQRTEFFLCMYYSVRTLFLAMTALIMVDLASKLSRILFLHFPKRAHSS
jgi:hypothetical protein